VIPESSSQPGPAIGLFSQSEDKLKPLISELTLAGFRLIDFSRPDRVLNTPGNLSGSLTETMGKSALPEIFLWNGANPHPAKLNETISEICGPEHEPLIAAAVMSNDPKTAMTALDQGASYIVFPDLHPSMTASQLWNIAMARRSWLAQERDNSTVFPKGESLQLNEDMKEAGKLQRRILPPLGNQDSAAGCGKVEYDYLFLPCLDVGGDFIDIETLPGGRTLFYLADVAGHGIRSALVTIHIREFVRSLWRDRPGLCASPLDALEQINTFLLGLNSIEYASMAFCVYEPSRRKLRVATGAHHGPVALISPSGVEKPISLRGKPLGVFDNVIFRVQNLQVEPGDILLLCSDGSSDQRNPDGEVPGRGRIVQAAAEAVKLCGGRPDLSLVLAEMLGFLERWKGRSIAWDDDVTLALFRF
jgi:sigma-B regulation protein RsbU (phosphoserine phosphatase)